MGTRYQEAQPSHRSRGPPKPEDPLHNDNSNNGSQLSFNTVSSSSSPPPFLFHLASQVATTRPGAVASTKIVLAAPGAPPPKPTVAASLTARFARIPDAPAKAQTATLAAAAAAAITNAVQPERVNEAFERTDAAIEQWRLNTVMEVRAMDILWCMLVHCCDWTAGIRFVLAWLHVWLRARMSAPPPYTQASLRPLSTLPSDPPHALVTHTATPHS